MSKYAIIETGSKQYWVEPNAVIDVELLPVEEGSTTVELANVLLAKDGDNVQIGKPLVSGAKVVCEYLGAVKGKKVISFRYRRRKASKRIRGHRQQYARLVVKDILI